MWRATLSELSSRPVSSAPRLALRRCPALNRYLGLATSLWFP